MNEERCVRLKTICRYSRFLLILFLALMAFAAVVFGACVAYVVAVPDSAFPEWTHDELLFESVLIFCATMCLLSVLIYLYKLLHSLESETTPFTRNNVHHLRMMAFIMIGSWFLLLALEVIMITMLGLDGSKYDYDFDVLVFGVVCYVLSLVFQYGVELQDESDSFV